jgi:hypothetical protein
MNARTTLEGLKHLGIELRADGDHLHYEGPEEAITPELLDRLREHKAKLIKMLTNEEGCQEVYARPKELSMHQLTETGWESKERCGKTIWQSPENGFWYSQEMALVLLERQNNDPGEEVNS